MTEHFDWSTYPPNIYKGLTEAAKCKIIMNVHEQALYAARSTNNTKQIEISERIIAIQRGKLCLLGEQI